VAKTGTRYARTSLAWQPDEERIARVIATRKREAEQMRAYVTHEGCRMEYLIRLLDDPDAGPCGRCANDVGRGLPREVSPELVRAAVDFLRRSLRRIEPRKRWVEGADGGAGTIAQPNEDGIALCVFGDAGWGKDVERGRWVDGGYADTLVVAAVRAIRDQWRPEPSPEWVTAVPSRHARVGAFAAAIAAQLGLPYVDALTSVAEGSSQKAMQNSVLQLANARSKLGILESAVPAGPVLLVDDLVDSRWTMTVAGSLLRDHGSGPVLPFALAAASSRDG
jgi:ATP-dependent DNA helicase RecQ